MQVKQTSNNSVLNTNSERLCIVETYFLKNNADGKALQCKSKALPYTEKHCNSGLMS